MNDGKEGFEFSLGDSSSGSFTTNMQAYDLASIENVDMKPMQSKVIDLQRFIKMHLDTIMSSIFGVSIITVIIGGVVLLLIRPAFVIERGKKPTYLKFFVGGEETKDEPFPPGGSL